jgi:hypothetical protein
MCRQGGRVGIDFLAPWTNIFAKKEGTKSVYKVYFHIPSSKSFWHALKFKMKERNGISCRAYAC